MDLADLDPVVQFFCTKGLAESTHSSYGAGLNCFCKFCRAHNAEPFPVSENLLCYFVALLGQEGLAPSTLKTYLAGIRNAQIMRGFPESRQSSSLPRLKLLQAGVAQVRAQQGLATAKRCLPVTPVLLRQIGEVWSTTAGEADTLMLWAQQPAASSAFSRW